MSRSDQNYQHDAELLDAYLDQLTGAASAAPSEALSPEIRNTAVRLFALARVAGPLDSPAPTEEHPMATLPAAASPLALNPSTTYRSPARPAAIRRFWTRSSRVSQATATAAVVLLTLLASLGFFRAIAPSGGDGDGDGFYGAVPVATVPEDAVTSSIPYPTADECTATPRTREEVVEILRTPPLNWHEIRHLSAPDRATADDVMATFRHWQACKIKGLYYEFSAELMTEDAVRFAVYGPPFSGSRYQDPPPEPLSREAIEGFLDFRAGKILGLSASGTPIPAPSPVPPSTEPVLSGQVPTIFPEDLTVATVRPVVVPGSDLVHAEAYIVDLETNEIVVRDPENVLFAKNDGRWQIAATWTEAAALG